MDWDEMIWKIWELEEEARKKEQEAEELRRRLEELHISHEVRGGEIVDNVSFAAQPNSKDEFLKRLIWKLFELEKEIRKR